MTNDENLAQISDDELRRKWQRLEDELRPPPSGFIPRRAEDIRQQQLAIESEMDRGMRRG